MEKQEVFSKILEQAAAFLEDSGDSTKFTIHAHKAKNQTTGRVFRQIHVTVENTLVVAAVAEPAPAIITPG